jgi:hypothetical protein
LQESSGETAEEFRRSGELCQMATIGDHDEVVETLFMCVSMGPARKVLVGVPACKVWVREGEFRSIRVEIDNSLDRVGLLFGPSTCLCVGLEPASVVWA